MKKLGKILATAALVGITAIGLAACGNKADASKKLTPVTVGGIGSDYQTWQHIAASPEAKKLGLKLTVKEISIGKQLNDETANGDVDVNAFQSYAFLKAYNHETKGTKVAALGTTYLEPVGIYSHKYKSVKDLPKNATVGISSNPANGARELLLLQSAGLIKLKKGFNTFGTSRDIVSNPKHIKIQELNEDSAARYLPDLDAVLISNTIALEAKLNVLKDSIYHEKADDSTRDNIHVLATTAKQKHNKTYLKLVKLYHEPAIQKWIKSEFKGTKVEVNKPLSYLNK
ncbi:MetQ/NlpA family ABC transporter substrate-binding protein [Lacticaseibacillus pabuli]|uniref:MetQ/NlpA family ABC transporter substrate-binding protein n=1 Tax=Lacticaseibacillus pabuli TaxID=3025672 RepID=A0ABY7WT16_9LACO|nr:MetQ/NlpA family ABC transporter substrate-binding protein [Lacticaseibacillus sp. KACC 23028]WDF82886.1 MetQ/NlpA family ABC transporter substrate-binding protein [Lacticaseibacillus sp. KACC 23028]